MRVLPLPISLAAALVGATAPARGEEKDRRDLRTVLFSSAEIGGSQFSNAGFKRTLTGSLDETGLVAMGIVGFGTPVRPPPEGGPVRYATQGAALIGFQQSFDRVFVSVVAGPEIDADHLLAARSASRLKLGGRAGGRLMAEAWIRPDENTLVTAQLVAGSARAHAWARVAAGYRVWREVYAGPEAGFYGEPGYEEWRLGLHATGIRIGRQEIRIGGGWRRAGAGDKGFYVTVSRHRER